jgi:hypothetical protein
MLRIVRPHYQGIGIWCSHARISTCTGVRVLRSNLSRGTQGRRRWGFPVCDEKRLKLDTNCGDARVVEPCLHQHTHSNACQQSWCATWLSSFAVASPLICCNMSSSLVGALSKTSFRWSQVGITIKMRGRQDAAPIIERILHMFSPAP